MKKLIVSFLLIVSVLCLPTFVSATEVCLSINDSTTPYRGNGIADDPYCYLIDGESRVVWKHLCTLQNSGAVERYECRENGTKDGALLYDYEFTPQQLKQSPDGPYFLGIRTYEGKAIAGLPEHNSALYFTFSTKRNFPGPVRVRLLADRYFSDGEQLTLSYYGGYDSTVIHGAAPVVMEDEIKEVDTPSVLSTEVPVVDGMAVFDVRHGGNYVLSPQKLDFSELTTSDTLHYDAGTVLGTIDGLFPTDAVARTVANALNLKVTDKVTQGEIDSIQTMYLAELKLTDISELSRTYFAGLERLDLSGNDLTEISSLSMPRLAHLDLSGNQLSSLSFVSGLSFLTHLDASDNQISALPGFDEFSALLTLDLHQNFISILPSLDGTQLRYLDISGNPSISVNADLSSIDAVVADEGSPSNNTQSQENHPPANNMRLPIACGLIIVVVFLLGGITILTKQNRKAK